MTDERDAQRAAIERKLQAHRQWLVTATRGRSLTTTEYAAWRAKLMALQAAQGQLAQPA